MVLTVWQVVSALLYVQFLLVVGIKESNSIVIALSAFLLAGNLALRFNFYPAKIFLGDTEEPYLMDWFLQLYLLQGTDSIKG